MKHRNLQHHDNWATPIEFYERLDAEFHFDFDPCPLNMGVITPETDGLLKEWGNSNFVNPPYSRKLKEAFIMKAISESMQGKTCVLLLPVSTSTHIFNNFLLPHTKEIRFVIPRIPFEGINQDGKHVGKGGTPQHDSMVVVLGRRTQEPTKVKSFFWRVY